MNENRQIEHGDIQYKLHSHVPALVESDEAWEALKNRYPQMLADLTSAKFNPNCSCRNRVGSFLEEKYESSEEEKKFIFDLFSIPSVKEKSLTTVNQIRARENAYQNFPRIHVIKKGEKSWGEFLAFLQKNSFEPRAFSVVDRDDETLTVYLM